MDCGARTARDNSATREMKHHAAFTIGARVGGHELMHPAARPTTFCSACTIDKKDMPPVNVLRLAARSSHLRCRCLATVGSALRVSRRLFTHLRPEIIKTQLRHLNNA